MSKNMPRSAPKGVWGKAVAAWLRQVGLARLAVNAERRQRRSVK